NELTIEKFIGQSSKIDDTGFSQKLQTEILEKFRKEEINILIATSVAEEGIDIPNVDSIIFYEPTPSEIRLIQRRGRTGRYAPGRCYILITEDTVDIPFYHVARRKENSMKLILTGFENIELTENLERSPIPFSILNMKKTTDSELVKNFEERREKEKVLLANRSIEEILSQLEVFCNSEDYRKMRKCGVTFFSDLVKIDSFNMKNKIMKFKGKRNSNQNKRKIYLNKNLKSLINIVKGFGEEGKIDFDRLLELAEEEEIVEKKFITHFNQACYLGYLKKQNNCVHFLRDYE
ncbi:MAG: helicase-related protein, partial [Candidatus Heimdallarchaeota archaeon]